MKIAMLIVMFLLLGAFFIISQNNLPMNNSENLSKFISGYTFWINDILKNTTRLGGYIVKLEWLPDSGNQK